MLQSESVINRDLDLRTPFCLNLTHWVLSKVHGKVQLRPRKRDPVHGATPAGQEEKKRRFGALECRADRPGGKSPAFVAHIFSGVLSCYDRPPE